MLTWYLKYFTSMVFKQLLIQLVIREVTLLEKTFHDFQFQVAVLEITSTGKKLPPVDQMFNIVILRCFKFSFAFLK